MMGATIQLKENWAIGSKIGDPSGFGEVYEATSDSGFKGAAKFIPKTPGSSRELLFESLSGAANIVPVVDTGETSTHYVIVMPLAKKSLRAYLDENKKLAPIEAVSILKDISCGLRSLENNVVHRDIKPANILLLDCGWCITDFGIARYAEASTEAETRKYMMTRPYAAPEQWRGERATNKTDVYALGIIGYEMLCGQLPFLGPDFRDQHLNGRVPAVNSGFSALDSIVNDCLRKSANARPIPVVILDRLESCLTTLTPAAEGLRALDGQIVVQAAAHDAAESARRSVAETRAELANDAAEMLIELVDELVAAVRVAAPSVQVQSSPNGTSLSIGSGNLTIPSMQISPQNALDSGMYHPPFDVVAYTSINVRQPPNRYGHQGRSHSLWYCDAQEEGVYQWFELSFMRSGFVGGSGTLDPFSLAPSGENATIAFIPVMGTVQLSWPPVALDYKTKAEFLERWIRWFTAVAGGRYESPSHAPDAPHGRGGGYRQAKQKR